MTSLLKFSAYRDNLLVLFSRCCFYFADVFVSVVVDEDELYNCFVHSECFALCVPVIFIYNVVLEGFALIYETLQGLMCRSESFRAH